MCGRYNITDSPEVQALLEHLDINIGPLPVRYNIAPTENVPVIFNADDQNQLAEMRWWLVPSWSDGPSTRFAMFNARSETIATSKAYREPFKHKRAIIPASSFVEWKREGKGKQPYLISPESGVFAFAGVWDCWEKEGYPLYSCSIITTESVDSFQHIHNRMPALLSQDEMDSWLNADTPEEDLKAMLQPKFPSGARVGRVDPSINNARNKEEPRGSEDPETIH